MEGPDEEENPDEVLHNTDGLVWGLYSHLWRKTHRGQPCPNINLPHTVVYKNARPIAWYFTSQKDNKIYRKQRSKVVGQPIWEAMSSGQDPNVDACAWFSGNMTLLASQPKKDKNVQDEQYVLNPEEETKESASFEYLPFERVHHLTYPGQYTVVTEQIYDGILQKFVAPREAHDSIIRAIWSPTACVCERRTNRNLLTDQTKPLSARIASFEHSNFWLNSHQVLPEGSVVVERLTSQCENVVNHLRDTTSGKVSVARMELYFKLDTHNRIWLMYCNTLRLDRTVLAIDRSPSMQRDAPHRQYSLLDETRHSDQTRLPPQKGTFRCAMTGRECSERQRMDVSYKLLIQAWFREVAELANENDRIGAIDNIPPPIRRANPNITRDYYLRMRSQPKFLMETAPVSADAAATLAPAAAADLARTIARPSGGLARSAGGTKLAEPMPKIVRADEKDPRSLSLHRHQRGAGPRQDVPSSVKVKPAEEDNGMLYEPGSVTPEALLPRPRSPPSMVPVHSSGTTHRIPDSSRTARLTNISPFTMTGPLPGTQRPNSGSHSTSPHARTAHLHTTQRSSRSPQRAHASLRSAKGLPAMKPLFEAPPREVPLHQPRMQQHVLGARDLQRIEDAKHAAKMEEKRSSPPRDSRYQGLYPYAAESSKQPFTTVQHRKPHAEQQRYPGATQAGGTMASQPSKAQTLQQMKEAYASAQAEATTQELVAQAHELTRQPGPQANGSANGNHVSAKKEGTANGAAHVGPGQQGGGGKKGGAAAGDSLTQEENEELQKALAEEA